MPTRLTETTPLTEVGTSTTGRMVVQAISAGLGSSGLYRPEVLEQAARDRLIKRGTPLHLDHASESERHDRPERSVQTIAGVFTGDATYDTDRQSLVGEVQIFTPFRERLTEMAPYLGLSISGSATDVVEGDHEGRKVPVIEALAAIDSVDFVVRAGRGGQVLTVAESERPSAALLDHITAAYGPALTEAGITLTNVPATRPDSTTPTQESQEDTMPNIEEAELTRLREDAGRVTVLEAERDTAIVERDQARTTLAERDRTDRARTVITDAARTAGVEFTALEMRGLLADLPLTEAGVLDEATLATTVTGHATAAVEAATRTQGLGVVRGFGGDVVPGDATDAQVREASDKARALAFGRTVKEA